MIEGDIIMRGLNLLCNEFLFYVKDNKFYFDVF